MALQCLCFATFGMKDFSYLIKWYEISKERISQVIVVIYLFLVLFSFVLKGLTSQECLQRKNLISWPQQ